MPETSMQATILSLFITSNMQELHKLMMIHKVYVYENISSFKF